MIKTVSEIEKIIFGVASADYIKSRSVCKIDSTKMSGYGSVYDPRMGYTIDGNTTCETCLMKIENCPGHFGYIDLKQYVINPFFYKSVLQYLRCFCFNCHKLLVNKDILEINGILNYKGSSRFNKVLERLDKCDICCNCMFSQPKYLFQKNESQFTISSTNKDGDNITTNIDVKYIKNILDNISNDDINLIGLNPERVHPKDYIFSVLPVIPTCSRCPVTVDGNMSDDDLTLQYIEIVKLNNELCEGEMNEENLKIYNKLRFRISTLFDNTQGKAKHATNGRAYKGLRERFSGKKGIIRENLMGKRTDQSARTVIDADPTLKIDEIGIPAFIADTLYYPEIVNNININKLQKMVDDGDVISVINENGSNIILGYACINKGTQIFLGDIIVKNNGNRILIDEKFFKKDKRNFNLQIGDKIIRDGIEIPDIKYPSKRSYKLKVGQIVRRKLQKGDILLLNRQPTLHAGSMMAMKVIPRREFNQKSITFNLAICKPFNADFDGDEMNLHAPLSIESRTELEELSSIKNHIITAQTSTPIVVIVQDSLIAMYKMTKMKEPISKSRFFNIICYSTFKINEIIDGINHIKSIYKELNLDYSDDKIYTGKNLFSLILPKDFNYNSNNDASKEEPNVIIYKGVLLRGIITKSNIGSSGKSIIQYLYNEYERDIVCRFIDNVQFISIQYNLYYGFTVSIGDCIATKKEEISDSITKCMIEAEVVEKVTMNPIIREIRINASLNKAADIGRKIAKNALSIDNAFNDTVISGAKGDFFNIAQITGVLGQQNMYGNRIPYQLNNGKRSLPHYGLNEELSLREKYESKGFITSSFIQGLNPKEFFFHSMSGRVGICDTATGTADSGYIQRRIGKCTEDIQIRYDGTVRDVNDTIIQYFYGDGFDYKNCIIINGEVNCCDVSRIANKLTMNREQSKYLNKIDSIYNKKKHN